MEEKLNAKNLSKQKIEKSNKNAKYFKSKF
jgi:hypothetical protein